MKNNKLPDFWGGCELRANLSLEELAEILSKEVFSGAKFGGKEKSIHEEIPAIFIESSFMGMLIILEGYSGMDKWFILSVHPYGDFNRYLIANRIEKNRIDLDFYIYHLLKMTLNNFPEIHIIEPEVRT